MVVIRNVNEIILNLIDFFRLTQPDLDTKPGSVARDLFIDAPASELSQLYDELATVSNSQSLRIVSGSNLDKLAQNFGIVRQQANKATGVALFTFSSIPSTVSITKGSSVISSTGLTFVVSSGISVTPGSSNYYKSIAAKYRDQLDLIGITDTYAVEVTVIANSPGIVGNIGKYSLKRTSIAGVSNVTNINSFSGGSDIETDAVFRNRVLSSFSGSSVGTELGYRNAALATNGVLDAIVVEPGDSLMTRDGTEVVTNPDGSKTIITEGAGGKVDIVILGNSLQQTTDSFIYKDKSNNNDPTDIKNNYIIGQIAGDENKSINRKRIDNISNSQLPQQPVNQVLQVVGSLSGANFVEKTIDSLGRVSGNYEILKDTGVYGGSAWGFDSFKWISNKVSMFEDNHIKSQLNSQDVTNFKDITEIHKIQQIINITNEDSEVTSDRSIIKLIHTPASNVTRVFNVNTGERYIVVNQNLDNTGIYNTTGRIKISGNTLPTTTDVLQVDYNWVVEYDQYSDYDGLYNTSNIRPATDSIDWGYSSIVKNEKITFTLDPVNNYFVGISSHPIGTIVTANKFSEIDGSVVKITSGIFANRLSVTLNNLPSIIDTVESIKIKNANTEQYSTAQKNGTIINSQSVAGINVVYNTTIIFPSDTTVLEGQKVSVMFNSIDVYHQSNSVGNSSGTQINIPSSQVNTSATTINLLVSYISSTPEIYASAITSLPTSRSGNTYSLLNNDGFNENYISNIFKKESQTIKLNTSNQFYIDLSLIANDFSQNAIKIISIIRTSDGKQLWNQDNPGTFTISTSGNYQLILSGYNIPVVADRVIVFYTADDSRRFQPFTYQNTIINYRVSNISLNSLTQRLFVPLTSFTSKTGISFSIIEPNTNDEIFSITDGYIVNNGSTALIGSSSINFSSTYDLVNKKLKIFDDEDNNGVYDIISYDIINNIMTISLSLEYINHKQISITRLLDGKEIWTGSGTIDITNNRLILPNNVLASTNDKVFVNLYNFYNLKQSLTRIVSSVTDQNLNTGTITVSGITITKVKDVIFTATNTGLKLNLSEAVRKAMNISSITAIPSNIKIARIIKLEKVITASASNDEVISVLSTYDLKNTTIKDNSFYIDDFTFDNGLQNLDFILPSTQNNTSNNEIQNLPKLGDKLRITFYYSTDNDFENLSYTRNGVLYTNKKFALINKVFVNSGFNASLSTRVSFTSLTQPNSGARYKSFYDYLAPKPNERISIEYNFNKLISDVQLNIEQTRPINADVLVRAAKPLLVDLTMNVVISDTTTVASTTILQNLKDQLLNTLNSTILGGVIDQITLINIAQGVSGIARARILYFNKNGNSGQVLSLSAQNDEYFISNNLIINIETR